MAAEAAPGEGEESEAARRPRDEEEEEEAAPPPPPTTSAPRYSRLPRLGLAAALLVALLAAKYYRDVEAARRQVAAFRAPAAVAGGWGPRPL